MKIHERLGSPCEVINLTDVLTCFVSLRLEVLDSKGEPEDESEGVGVAVDAGGVQGRPALHRQHRDQEREAPQEQLHDLEGEVDAFRII